MNSPPKPHGKGSVPFISIPSDSALPATTNVQNTLLGGSNTSNLSPSKPKKRKSEDNMSKINKAAKLTPQNLCSKTKLDSGKDVAASFSSAIPLMELDPESQLNEAGTSKFEKATSIVHTGETTNSETLNHTIKGGDTLSVDSEDVGVDDLTVAELIKELKVRPNIRSTHEVVNDVAMGNKNTAQLALNEVMDAVPAWEDYLDIVKNRDASRCFDGTSLNSFHDLYQSAHGLTYKKGIPHHMRKELENLLRICKVASNMYLRQGRYNRNEFNDQITKIKDLAKFLTQNHEMGTSAKSKTGFAKPKAVESSPPKDSCDLQSVSTSGELSGRSQITIETGKLARVPSALYFQKSRIILHNIWSFAGTEVKDALEYVHDKMVPKQHELLCRGAWLFKVGKTRPLSREWVKFSRFAFKQKPQDEERRVFNDMAIEWRKGSDSDKTAEIIIADWQNMFFAIGENLKHQLQKMGYDLCPCHISQPHSMTVLNKSLQFLHSVREKDAEKDLEKDAAERIKQAVSACTALVFLESITEEGDNSSEHTYKDSHKAIRTAVQGLENAKGLLDEAKCDLSNIIAYLDMADYMKGLESMLPPGYNSSSNAIADIGESLDTELKEIEQLALKDLIRRVSNWRSNVTFLRPSTSYDEESYENLNNLVNSIQKVIRENKVPSGIIEDLKRLRRMCKAASEIHQSHGRCYHEEQNKIEILITDIENFATILTRDYKTDVVDENDAAGPSCGG